MFSNVTLGYANACLTLTCVSFVEGLAMLETVEKNIEMFTKKEIERADDVHTPWTNI